jgi:ArsR family transcriptional regulator
MKLKSSQTPVDRMFRAFSDRTRLRILHLLREGELCVCDLVNVIGAPQPKISRHLAYLRKAGLVLARKQGLWSYYKLAPARDEFHQKLLDCLTCCFGSVPELTKDARALRAGKSCGQCCD